MRKLVSLEDKIWQALEVIDSKPYAWNACQDSLLFVGVELIASLLQSAKSEVSCLW